VKSLISSFEFHFTALNVSVVKVPVFIPRLKLFLLALKSVNRAPVGNDSPLKPFLRINGKQEL
jgi:hypothetical protein